MSLWLQVRAEITQIDRAASDQINVIEEFRRQNRDNLQLVRSAVAGSSQRYDVRMGEAIARADEALRSSVEALRRAQAGLERIKAL